MFSAVPCAEWRTLLRRARRGEVDGLLSLSDFRQRTGVELPAGPYETVGGLLVTMLGHVPAVGDEVETVGHRLTVTAVQGWRVQRLIVAKLE